MSEWRLIETDPPEIGVIVLLGWPARTGFTHPVAVGLASWVAQDGGNSVLRNHPDATHWMPLPRPPVADSGPVGMEDTK